MTDVPAFGPDPLTRAHLRTVADRAGDLADVVSALIEISGWQASAVDEYREQVSRLVRSLQDAAATASFVSEGQQAWQLWGMGWPR